MVIRFPDFEYDEDANHYNNSVENSAQFIKLQRDLKHIIFRESHYSKAIGTALKVVRSSLRHVEFIETVFDKYCRLDWLPYCSQLETLTFIDSEMLIEEILIPLRFSPLTQLRSLIFNEDPVPIDTLEALISNNINLQEIAFGWPSDCNQYGNSKILTSISKFCPNLTKLGATFGGSEICDLILILDNCKHLQYLEIYGNGYLLVADEIMPKLGKSLPSAFGELVIGAQWRFNADYLVRFFENSNHIPLYRFVIKICDFINEEHLSVIVRNSQSSLKFFTFMDKTFLVAKEGMKEASKWLRQNLF